MSYVGKRLRARRAMSGLSSRPYGPPVAKIAALGAFTPSTFSPSRSRGMGNSPAGVIKTRAYPIIVNGPGLQGPPDWYLAMQGASLGDDTPTTGAATLTDGTTQWQQAMLSQTSAIAAAQQEFTKRESLQRWIQIGATLAIPLSAAIWRAIFRGSRDSI